MVFSKSVKVRMDANSDMIRISSSPEMFSIVFFVALLVGLFALPFTEYRNNYFVYICILYPMGLAAKYYTISIQDVRFENKSRIRIRKGLNTWSIPFESVTGGYTTYKKVVTQANLTRTYYLDFELKVNLPDNKKHYIRNGTANIFHYGFSQWGREQEKIWAKFNDILDGKDIPNLTAL